MPRERKYRRKWMINHNTIQDNIRWHQDRMRWWGTMIDFYYKKKPKGWRTLGWQAQAAWQHHSDEAQQWIDHEAAHNTMLPHW